MWVSLWIPPQKVEPEGEAMFNQATVAAPAPPPPVEPEPQVERGRRPSRPTKREAPPPEPEEAPEEPDGEGSGCTKRKMLIWGIIAAIILLAIILIIIMLYLYVFKRSDDDKSNEEAHNKTKSRGAAAGRSGSEDAEEDKEKSHNDYSDKTADEDFQVYALEEHNKLRADHEAGPLTANVKMCQQAYQCAEYYLDKQTIDHSCPHKYTLGDSGEKYGENLYMGRRKKGTLMDFTKIAIEGWYREWQWYDFDEGKPMYPDNSSLKTGHFTQMVWLDAKELGTGALISEDAKASVVVCLYNPHGNVKDEYKHFVKRKKDTSSSDSDADAASDS